MIKYLQRRYALSRKGAIDNIKGILCCALQNISFMLPVGLLYRLVSDMMSGTLTTGRIPFYVIGCVAAALFIVVCTQGWNTTTPFLSPMWSRVCAVWGLPRN